MKAFAIKNKEGEYYDCWSLGFTDIINECSIYQNREIAENDIKNCIKNSKYLGYEGDCEVVEITIAETKDLEKDFVSKNYHDVVVENYKIAINNLGNGQTENEILVQQLAEKDKEIKELKTRISELEDKDWYEKCIKQLEEQNNKLIKERDELAFEKRNIFGLVEKVSDKGQLEIRKQVCEEIYNYIMDNWEKIMGRQGRYLNFGGTCLDLKEDLQKIVENGYKKGE